MEHWAVGKGKMGKAGAERARAKGKRQEYDWKTIFISAANMSDKSK